MHRPETFAIPAGRRKVAGLLAGCALGLVLATVPQAAVAQAFAGTPTVVSGSPTFIDGAGVSTISLKDAETVINWAPTDTAGAGTIDFLPSGNFAIFTGPAGFTVLNRVLPVDGAGAPTARMIALNGRIDSTVGRFQSGNVWFYSPTGIVVGPSAIINVGGLILTTNDILFGPANTGGSELYGPGNTVLFRGPAGSGGLVDVQASDPGAGITATSYVALVAPRVQQAGMVSADGPIGYVGAEQVDLKINAGLFDISILAGTTDPNGVVHTGTTTGPASATSSDQQQIMMVAMPKATALTMLLSGSIGYTPAALAANEGSSVILSAGYPTPVPGAESATALGNISIDNATFQNATSAYASNDIDVTAAAGPVGFGGSTSLFAQHKIDFTLGASTTVSAAGDLTLNAGKDGAGGTIDIALGSKASLLIGRALDLNATSFAIPYASSFPVNASGGSITVDANGGSLSALTLFADASATGGFDSLAGGNATAGSVSVTARNGGSIAASDLSLLADANGGNSDNAGGSATAGSLSLTSLGGALNFDTVRLEADAFAGPGSVVSGAANGGKASISLNGGLYNWESLDVSTNALSAFDGGTPGAQGNSATGRADAITLMVLGGADLAVANDINLSSNATATVNRAGSSAQAGHVLTSVLPGATLSFGAFTATAEAGVTYPSALAIAPVTTPDATGGRIDFTVGGNVIGRSVVLDADASVIGASSAAGTAKGGTIAALVDAGGNLTLDDGSGTASLDLHANGMGAVGQSAGKAIGGSATLTLSDAVVDVNGTVNVAAGARANDIAFFYPSGTDPVGFDATGGSARIDLLAGAAGTASLTADDLFVDAGADASTPSFFYGGGDFGPPGIYSGPFQANGGKGTGGTATLSVAGGNLAIANVSVGADGSGGISSANAGATPFRSGDGLGGTAILTVSGGSSTITDLTVSADGFGGASSPIAGAGDLAALAGDGFGGNARLTISGGTLQSDTLTLEANGTGGDGADHSAGGAATDGGNGTGGIARLVSPFGSTGQLTVPSLSILANGTGGSGGTSVGGTNGNGGDGRGGTAATQLADGAFTLGPLTLNADGIGGDGEAGGEASGGTAQFVLNDSAIGPSAARTLAGLQLFASGLGGTGAGGIAQSDAGLAQLTVDTAAGLTISGDLGVSVQGTRAAPGLGFSSTTSGALFRVTGNVAIDTARDVQITATSPFFVNGGFATQSRSFTETGLLSAFGGISITAPQGISADQLRTDNGTTALLATGGAINVADLTSFDAVTAQARSISIAGGGRLIVTSAQATAGDLSIAAGGDLIVQSASATGAMNLSSSAGALTANGALTAGGNFVGSGRNGVSLTSLNAGGSAGLTSGNGAVSASGDVASGGAFSASGLTGVSFGNLASGGTTSLTSGSGTVTVTGLSSAGGVTAVGQTVTLNGTGPLSFTNAQATAGNLVITTPGNLSFAQASATGTIGMTSSAGSLTATGPISAGGAVNLFGSSGLSLGTLTSGGTTLINAGTGALTVTSLTSAGSVTALGRSLAIASPGALTFSSIAANGGAADISTAGNLAIGDGNVTGALTLTSADGAISSTGTLTAGGAVAADGETGLDFNRLNSGGTTFLVSAGGPIHVTRLASAGLVTANAGGSIDIGSAEGLRFDTVDSLDTVSITAAGDLAFNAINAGSNLTLSSTGGGITAGGNVQGGFTRLSSLNDISFGADLRVGGSISVDTRGAFVVGGDTLTDDASIIADRGITMQGLRTGESTRLTASDGNILIENLNASGVIAAQGLDIDIASTGNLFFIEARATQDKLAIMTGGNLTAQTLFANRDISLSAGGRFALSGEARATNIAVSSGDIDIAAGASLGVRGSTSQLTLFNGDPSQETYIGGTAGAGYSLDGDEVARLFADDGITLGVADGAAPNEGHVTIGDFALTFDAGAMNIGTGGVLEITSPGEISIVGNVALTTGDAEDRFVIDPTRVELNTETGSIAMLDASGSPLGRLEVTGDTVAVGTGAALDQLRTLNDISAINALLDQPGGTSNLLQAGTMVFTVVDALFIQNSGASSAFGDRRGFSANALEITTGSAATRIAVNGVIIQNGAPVTGLATTPLVTINGQAAAAGGQFDALSTINGCVIGADCTPPPPLPLDEFTPPSNDDLTPPVSPDNPGQGGLSGTLVQLEDNQPLIAPPLVDEPITGVGNDDLWVPQCADPKQEGCPQQDTDK
jgi:filamentous hemagglutinin family protein